jgi:hypothetical protein
MQKKTGNLVALIQKLQPRGLEKNVTVTNVSQNQKLKLKYAGY